MDLDIVEKLWQTSKAITGFAVVQALVYLYVTEKSEIRPRIRERWILVFGLIIAFHTVYILGIGWCHTKMLELATSNSQAAIAQSALFGIRVGQQGIVILLGALALYITWLNKPLNEKR